MCDMTQMLETLQKTVFPLVPTSIQIEKLMIKLELNKNSGTTYPKN